MGLLIVIISLLVILIFGTIIFLLIDIRGYLSTINEDINIIRCETKIININLDYISKLEEVKSVKKSSDQ